MWGNNLISLENSYRHPQETMLHNQREAKLTVGVEYDI